MNSLKNAPGINNYTNYQSPLSSAIGNHLTNCLLILLASSCTAWAASGADIDGSGKVDFNDLEIMQYYWLDAGPVADIAGADGNSDGMVDGLDLTVLGGSWRQNSTETIAALVAEATEFSADRVWATHSTWPVLDYNTRYPKQTIYDSNFDNHYEKWEDKATGDWTSGFFPGCLWYMYDLTGDPNYKNAVETSWLPGLENVQYWEWHDAGFVMMSSYGNGYRLTGEPNYLPILLQTAQSHSTNYNSQIGCLGGERANNEFFTNIDHMPTIEILFWGAKNGGDPNWYDMALSHAYKASQDQVRGDGTTNHRLYYDLNDPCGETFRVVFNPGYSADSCWSRGQAWAVYGFAMTYRETGDPNMLATAQLVSDYFVDNLPADNVPYYDFEDPTIPNTIRDTSAASAAAAGLLELSTLVEDPNYQQKYFQAGKDILTSLCTRHSDAGYLAKDAVGDPLSPSILMRGYKKLNNGFKLYERGTSWGDYYFLEALVRYRDMLGK